MDTLDVQGEIEVTTVTEPSTSSTDTIALAVARTAEDSGPLPQSSLSDQSVSSDHNYSQSLPNDGAV